MKQLDPVLQNILCFGDDDKPIGEDFDPFGKIQRHDANIYLQVPPLRLEAGKTEQK